MDGVILLRRAAESGLAVSLAGERLVLQGPGRLDALARELLANKPAILRVLAGDVAADTSGFACLTHGVTRIDSDARWMKVASAAGVGAVAALDCAACHCCGSPAAPNELTCSRCTGADLSTLNMPPICACGRSGYTPSPDNTWRCEGCYRTHSRS